MTKTPNSQPILSTFETKFETPYATLDPITIHLYKGEWLEIVGPPGSGKSLLFQLLSLNVIPKGANLVFKNKNIERLPLHKIAVLRRAIGSAAQTPLFLEQRSTLQNLVVPLVARKKTENALERALEILEEFDVTHLTEMRLAHLSQQERILVATMRAIIGDPEVIILDDLFTTLSIDYQNRFFSALSRRHALGASIILFSEVTTTICPKARVVTLPLAPLHGGL